MASASAIGAVLGFCSLRAWDRMRRPVLAFGGDVVRWRRWPLPDTVVDWNDVRYVQFAVERGRGGVGFEILTIYPITGKPRKLPAALSIEPVLGLGPRGSIDDLGERARRAGADVSWLQLPKTPLRRSVVRPFERRVVAYAPRRRAQAALIAAVWLFFSVVLTGLGQALTPGRVLAALCVGLVFALLVLQGRWVVDGDVLGGPKRRGSPSLRRPTRPSRAAETGTRSSRSRAPWTRCESRWPGCRSGSSTSSAISAFSHRNDRSERTLGE